MLLWFMNFLVRLIALTLLLGNVSSAQNLHFSLPLPTPYNVDNHSIVGSFGDKPYSSDEEKPLFYQVSATRRQANLVKFSKSMPGVTPNQLHEFVKALEISIKSYKLRIDNVADVYTVYWISAWDAAHGIKKEISAKQVKAVKDQVTRSFIQGGKIQTASDAMKQEFAEALIIQAVSISISSEQSQANPKLRAGLVQSVKQGAKAMGLDLDAMILTENGFQAKP